MHANTASQGSSGGTSQSRGARSACSLRRAVINSLTARHESNLIALHARNGLVESRVDALSRIDSISLNSPTEEASGVGNHGPPFLYCFT